jgi:ABC-type glutathione transport system ATPase component
MTCVLVTHEMGFAREIANEFYFTDRGVIVEHGPPASASGRSISALEFFLHRRYCGATPTEWRPFFGNVVSWMINYASPLLHPPMSRRRVPPSGLVRSC